MSTLLKSILEKHQLRANGILHIGAHEGVECEVYNEIGFDSVMWIEADPDVFKNLEAKINRFSHHSAHCVLASEQDNLAVEFFVANNNGHSSSLLPLNDQLTDRLVPGLQMAGSKILKTRRLDTYFAENGINISNYNVLNVDVQGAELMVLKGMFLLLQNFQLICAEIHLTRNYQNAVLLHELDGFMAESGFARVSTSAAGAEGEAYYLRLSPRQLKLKNYGSRKNTVMLSKKQKRCSDS